MAHEALPPPPLPLRPRAAEPRSGDPSPLGPPPSARPPADDHSDDAVTLERLLEVAVLTPAQAAHVAVAVLTAASTIGLGRRCDVRVSTPEITSSGRVRVEPATDPDAGVSVEDLLTQVIANARRLPVHPREYQVALLRRLEEVDDSTHEPTARAMILREALEEGVGEDADTHLTAQLAALVAAYGTVNSSRTEPMTPIHSNHAVRLPPATSAVPWSRRDLGPRRARRIGLRAGAALLACLVVLAGGYLALGRPGTDSDTPKPPQAAKHSTKPSNAPVTHHRAVVPTVAQPSAGGVTGVALQRLAPCRPSAVCPVRVTVSLSPAAVTQNVGWRVGVVRPCARHLTWSPITTVTAQPGWTHVYASSSVHIPVGHPYALVAVTTSPARAQSPPDRLTASAPVC
jgi:hypothetical protein